MSDELLPKLESVLFSSGRKMQLEELARLCNTPAEKVKEGLEILRKKYDEKESSLMLVEEGDSWKLTVREKYLTLVQNIVTETELPKSVIETLAIIAFKHPILQAEVVKIRSNKAYEHLAQLEDAGYIAREKHGRTRKIKLTQKFFDYFDLPPEKMRDAFAGFEAVEKSISEKEKELAQKLEKTEDKETLGKLEVYEGAEQAEQPPTVPPVESKPDEEEPIPSDEEEAAGEAPSEPFEEELPEQQREAPTEQAVEEPEPTEEAVKGYFADESQPKIETPPEEKADVGDLFKAESEEQPKKVDTGAPEGVNIMMRGGSKGEQISEEEPQEIQVEEAKAPAGQTQEEALEEVQEEPQKKPTSPEEMIESIIQKKTETIMHPPKEEKKPEKKEQGDFLESVYDEIEEEKEELEKKTR